ncbi:lysine-rich arabinogalactan protein 19-like [Arachis duranensis]|uniref:Lysine-rich arabinogalactan protein 19-like n=1 Tax=Arachis duranensis TaxID=130453 RepID=A0A6P4DQ04_ARADU|nr:lysine-rich arabinogalactan protein 19-like [Arachis duranensis]XP_025703752.1 lysine-rich arabinogalactan protein 19-like [Arachis hypogaea]
MSSTPIIFFLFPPPTSIQPPPLTAAAVTTTQPSSVVSLSLSLPTSHSLALLTPARTTSAITAGEKHSAAPPSLSPFTFSPALPLLPPPAPLHSASTLPSTITAPPCPPPSVAALRPVHSLASLLPCPTSISTLLQVSASTPVNFDYC